LTEAVAKRSTIGVGIIGVTPGVSWGSYTHVPALRTLHDYEIVAVSTSNAATAKEAAAALGIPAAYDNPHDLAMHPKVDLVTVSVKVPHHFKLVSAALEAGKMVYCEWPLGNGLDEAVALAGHARRVGARTVVGLQARLSPVIGYVRHLISDGYVGEVLSTTVVGSGGAWGPIIDRRNSYLCDAKNGATMLSIPVSHILDALCSVLGEIGMLSATIAQRRKTAQIVENSEILPMTAPDQVLINGVLQSGATFSVHYRGGESRATNLSWEINGTAGDLRVTGASGLAQMTDLVLEGARHDKLEFLDVPSGYRWVPPELTGPAVNVAQVYAQFAADLRNGTHLSADFDHAVRRHRMIAAIEESAVSGKRVNL